MFRRATKLRWRRRVKRSQQQVENIGVQAEEHLEKHFFKRLGRIVGIRRFVLAWVALFILVGSGLVVQMRALSPFYQRLVPGRGGIYTEGILGAYTNSNPIYASGAVDASVSRLMFSSLMKYDSQNKLVGDLAEKVKVSKDGLTYTVKLRQDARWHDGLPVTADDVVFTYKTIQKADAKSPLISNWQKIDVKAKGKYTVIFGLPHSLASFEQSLTNGIIPEHVLGRTPASELRSAQFNTSKPIGSGPFKLDAIQVAGNTPANREEQIGLVANKDYYGGQPNLERFVIRGFHSEEALRNAFEHKDINGASGLGEVPELVKKSFVAKEYDIPITGEVMIFLKNSQEILKEKKVRQALVRATNQDEIVKNLGYPVAEVDEPILRSHLGYDPSLKQLKFNTKQAAKLLDRAKWKVGSDGIRSKKGVPLSFELVSQSDSQYAHVAQIVQRQWRKVGVDLKVTLRPNNELQTTIASHDYDALLYGITIGPDPDVFAYWHSSQADPRAKSRLNFSEYESNKADFALSVARSTLDNKQRVDRYARR